jgi:hypothetical protein
VAFYVPLGPRGLVFRIGSFLTGAWGGFLYWQAARRRPFRAPSLAIAPILADAPPVL